MIKNTFYLTCALIGQKILSLAYFAFLTRTFAVAEIGTYVSILSLGALIAILTDLGVTPVIIREIAKEKDLSQFSSSLKETLSAALFFKAILIILGSAILAVVINTWYGTFTKFLPFLIIIISLDALHLLFYGMLRGVQNLRFESLGMIVGTGVSCILGVLLIQIKVEISSLFLALVAGSAVNTLLSFIYVFRKKLFQIARVTRNSCTHLVRNAWGFAAAGILARGYSQIDVLILFSLSSAFAVGLYSVPSKLVFAFQFIPLALSASLFPVFSHAFSFSQEKVGRIMLDALKYLLIIAALLSGSIIALGSKLVPFIFGEAYTSSITVLYILSISMIFGFLDYPIGAMLNAAGRQNVQTWSMFLTVIVNVSLNFFLIPRWGVLGAGLSALAGQITLLVSGLWYARGFFRETYGALMRLTFIIIMGALGASFVGFSLIHYTRLFGNSEIIQISGGGFTIVVLYSALLYFFRVVSKEDIVLLRNAVRIRK